MSIRDRLPKKTKLVPKHPPEPQWVTEGSETTKALYQATQQEYERVAELIKSGEATNPKDRKIVLARIANLAKKDRSLVNPRRQPALYDWISRLNAELETFADLHKAKPGKAKQLSKRELEREVGLLRRQVKAHSKSEIRAMIEEILASDVLDDRDKMSRENSRLRIENQELIDKSTRLQKQLRQTNEEIATLHQMLSPSQQAGLQGVRAVDKNEDANS